MSQSIEILANAPINVVNLYLAALVALLTVGWTIDRLVDRVRSWRQSKLRPLEREILVEMNGDQRLHRAVVTNRQKPRFLVQVNGRQFSRKNGSMAAKDALASLESLRTRGLVSKNADGDTLYFELIGPGIRVSERLKR